MTISEHISNFGGLPVREYHRGQGLADPAGAAWRLSIDWDEHEAGKTGAELLTDFLQQSAASEVTALVFGDWGGTPEGNNSATLVQTLVGASGQLPNLRALFLGEMTFEECEISWIIQSDLSLLWSTFPLLEQLRIRGGENLSLGVLAHECLKSLVIESGGLDQEVVLEVSHARLPQLEHLELWLGDDNYGANAKPEDLAPILAGDRFPKLRYLGLRNSCIADEVAKAVANAAVLDQVEELDMSMGTLGDEGALALLKSPRLRNLKRLNLAYHFMSDEVMQRFSTLPIEVNVDDQQQADEDHGESYRYVAVGE